MQGSKTLHLPEFLIARGVSSSLAPKQWRFNIRYLQSKWGELGDWVCCFKPCFSSICSIQKLQIVCSLLGLKNKIQLCVLCAGSVYTVAYTWCRVFFMARKEFFSLLPEKLWICHAVSGHSCRASRVWDEKETQHCLQGSTNKRESFLNG